jgi:hypothetical protein
LRLGGVLLIVKYTLVASLAGAAPLGAAAELFHTHLPVIIHL